MVFVAVDEDRFQLNQLAGLVIHAFPGSVVYKYSDPLCAVAKTIARDIDAVLVSARAFQSENWQMLFHLHRERPGVQVIILSDDEQLRRIAMESGAWDYLVRPVTGQKLREVLAAV